MRLLTDPRPWLATLLFLAAGLAGCFDEIGPGSDDGVEDARGLDRTFPDAWSEAALAYGEDHDHSRTDQHANVTTPNFVTVGYDPLISDEVGMTPYGNLCGDAQPTDDGRRLAVVETRSDVAFSLIDVTDPNDPELLGELAMRRTYVYDLAVVPDGDHVVLVTSVPREPDEEEPLDEPQMTWRSPCAPGGEVPVPFADSVEDPVPRPTSLLLVSIADPARPQVVDQRPLAGLGHSVSSTILDGRTWVVASTYATNSGLSNYQFYEIETTAAGSHLNYLSTFTIRTVDPNEFTRSLGHNDAWILEHPKTGTTLAWLAHWNHGLLIVDLSDPMMPSLVGQWTDFDPDASPADTGHTHSAYPLRELHDGRHYTVIAPEHPSHPPHTPTGKVYVVDTTDPGDPFPVAGWTFPHDVDWSGRLMFSLHYLSVHNTTLFVSAYHGGVWAIDLSPVLGVDQGWTVLDAVGVYHPAEVSPKPHGAPFRWAPTVEEVHAFDDGTLLTFDSNSGVYTFRFDPTQPITPPVPWPLDAPPGTR